MRVYYRLLVIIFLGLPLCQKENPAHKDKPKVATVTQEQEEHGEEGEEHGVGLEDGHDELENEEHAGEKPRLSQRQIERMGFVLAVARMMRIKKNTYRIPRTALVRVEDYTEIYTLDSGGALERFIVEVIQSTDSLSVVQVAGFPPDTRIVTKGSALARLAWLNATNPVEDDD